MTERTMTLAALLEKTGEDDFLRTIAESVLQLLMEADVDGQIGAGRHEHRRAPDLQKRLSRPRFRHPVRHAEPAHSEVAAGQLLSAVIQEAWIGGVSTRKVDELAKAMGLSGISKSSVSRLCADIDERVDAFLNRPLEGEWPYLWLDATYIKQRQGGRIVSVAAIIAVAANTEGRREIVGLHIGPSEAEVFWSDFLKELKARGLHGVKLVISDAHEGLKAAISRVMNATWQRCRVHWMRNAFAHVHKSQQSIITAALRQIFAQEDAETAHKMFRQIADQFRDRWPRLAAFMDASEHDVLAYMDFPARHRTKLHSTDVMDKVIFRFKPRSGRLSWGVPGNLRDQAAFDVATTAKVRHLGATQRAHNAGGGAPICLTPKRGRGRRKPTVLWLPCYDVPGADDLVAKRGAPAESAAGRPYSSLAGLRRPRSRFFDGRGCHWATKFS